MPNHAILTRYVKECYTASEDFLEEATILMRGQIVVASARSLVNCDQVVWPLTIFFIFLLLR